MKGDKFHFNQRPAQYVQFATGMNGDEDLGEDITMKGDKFHFNQNLVQFATGMNGDEDLGEDIAMKGDKFHFVQQRWNPVVVESTGPLPKCHGNNGPDGKNCVREVCSGTNGPMDGPAGTPCTREEPAEVPHYNTDPVAGRPYQTSGDLTHTTPPAWKGDDHNTPSS